MTSLTSNNMTPSEILQLNLNDSALDLLNAAIASHQVKNESTEQQQQQQSSSATEDEGTLPSSLHANTKRELDKDEQTTITAPKRAGRKPLDKSQIDLPLDPKQKRKAQNRAAQRAFRDRKEKHVSELQARIEELEALHATKDEDLIKENERLKSELKKLQEENYALKGAQFTFEFPVHNNNNSALHKNSLSSYSSEDSSSASEQHSPLSNSHTHEDDSTSADTPISNNLMQFGLISPPNVELNTTTNNSLDFLAIANDPFGLGNGFSTSQNFPTSNNTILPTVDLFHGKDDLFSNYNKAPAIEQADDFLFANEDLSTLFGSNNNELFGLDQFSFNAQFGIPETPTTKKYCTAEKKQYMLEQLKKGQREGKYVYQVHQEIKQACPDFNIDLLCDEMKKKATCSMYQFPITDNEVDAFVKCLDRV